MAAAPLPDDLILNPADEVTIRQHLLLVSLGKRPADTAIEVGRLLAVHSRKWLENQEIIVSGRRIAYVGPIGSYRGTVKTRVKHPELSAVPGFGEVHKHIESTHLTPEFEAELVLPRGNTWNLRGEPRVRKCEWPQEHRVLAEGAPRRLAAESLHPARLGCAAQRLGRDRRLFWL